MSGWMDGWMDRWLANWLGLSVIKGDFNSSLVSLGKASIGEEGGWIDEWMDGWMDEWMDGWMEG